MKKKVYLIAALVGALMAGVFTPTGDLVTILLLLPFTIISSLVVAFFTNRIWGASKDTTAFLFGFTFGIIGSYLGYKLLQLRFSILSS